MPVSSGFFHKVGPNLAQNLPLRPHPLSFIVGFQWSMLGDSIDINNVCCNSVVLKKKIGETLKNCFFQPNLHYKEVNMGHTQNEKQFYFGRNNKSRSLALGDFLFYQNIICFGWVMNLFLFCVMFFIKKGSFPAKTAVAR